MMTLVINGEPRTVNECQTVAGLLDLLGVTHQAVCVMVNQNIVPQDQFLSTPVTEGQQIEIIRFVGGG
jgi:thiamine biosynthesis protein ThiS